MKLETEPYLDRYFLLSIQTTTMSQVYNSLWPWRAAAVVVVVVVVVVVAVVAAAAAAAE
jgi:anti-sigma-K factor RskA